MRSTKVMMRRLSSLSIAWDGPSIKRRTEDNFNVQLLKAVAHYKDGQKAKHDPSLHAQKSAKKMV
jgi:hypothetical protein